MLIKLIKILSEFTMVEPRLKIKLRGKFSDLLDDQKAKSVQLEIIKSIIKIYKDDQDT